MCGIVGILGKEPVALDIVEALRRLEYRGYDSAGVATVENGHIERRRAEGKLRNLEARLAEEPLSGRAGIGHTRWATHGRPTESNAHPHMSRRVSVVHNGIIENFRELRTELREAGHIFETETDTETVVHLLTHNLNAGLTPRDALKATLDRLKGAFALGIVVAGQDDLLMAARKGSPLAIGHGDGEMYIGSDAIALAPFTNRVTYLDEGDWAIIRRSGAEIFDADGRAVTREVLTSAANALLVDKGNHRHFMLKEIHEQSDVVSRTISHYLDMADFEVTMPDIGVDLTKLTRVTISACGTAYYAGVIAKYWIENLARIPVEIDVASEMRYRTPPLPQDGLALFISQSGETADTLATLRHCKAEGQRIAAVVNVPTSTIAREADAVLPTLAGPEIGVASTKAFTCQLATLACFAIHLGRQRGTLNAEAEQTLLTALTTVPRQISALVQQERIYEELAVALSHVSDVLYLGRGASFPVALEGALKLKEISYIHAEGYAAGELKHGPIALIDEDMPVVVVAPKDALFEKTVSNMQEVAARGGRLVLVSDATAEEVGCELMAHIEMPSVHPMVAPIVAAIPMQLIAYYTAVHMGTHVDQPRNLAKSVTVE
ncbi:MAG: glutamine--fructose-6-phosphate transaminase (isomerizing) [Pseudomonadota bacterium]